jgi:hypothetical protein
MPLVIYLFVEYCKAPEHEEERSEDMDPKVDDDNSREDVDCFVALLQNQHKPHQIHI